MELSHNRHAANKSDELSGVIASCKSCHAARHNAGGKPCNRRPGRVMRKAEAIIYLASLVCFCGKSKKTQAAFCSECEEKLSPQSKLNLETLKNREWLAAFADAETELLARMVA
jgi:hypothetical protein